MDTTAVPPGPTSRRSMRASAPSLKVAELTERAKQHEESIAERARAQAIRQKTKKRAYDDAEIDAFNASHPSSDEEPTNSPALDKTIGRSLPKRSRPSEPSYPSPSPPPPASPSVIHLAVGNQTNTNHTHNRSSSGSMPREPRHASVAQPQHTTYASLPARLLPLPHRQLTPSRNSNVTLRSISSPQAVASTVRCSSTPFQPQSSLHVAPPSPALNLNRRHSSQPRPPLTPPCLDVDLPAESADYSSPPRSPEQVPILVSTPHSGTPLQKKRAASNSKRGKHAAYGAIEQMVLNAAGSYMVTRVTNTNPLPARDDLALSAEDAWNWACRHLGHKIKHTKDLLALIKVNIYNNRTLLQAACQAGVTAYGFQLASTGPESELIAHNKQLHDMLLNKHSFTYQNPSTRNGPYQSPVIAYSYSNTWFRTSNDTGVTHEALWLPVKLEALALVIALVEKGIKSYGSGTYKNIKFDINILRPRYYFFLLKLEEFSKQLAGAGLPNEFLELAETSARSKAGLPPANQVTSHDSNDNEDIARYINTRQAEISGEGSRAGTPGSSSFQQPAVNDYPTGRVLVESTQDTNAFGNRGEGSFLASLTNNQDGGHEFFNGFESDLLPSQVAETQYSYDYAANTTWGYKN